MNPCTLPTYTRFASISEDGKYRWVLARVWDANKPMACFVMLNPSTADSETDDPTIRKCNGFAHRLGFGSISVVNLFAYRSTYPRDLLEAEDPVGTEFNDKLILSVTKTLIARGGLTIVGWGGSVPAKLSARVPYVVSMLRDNGIPLYSLRFNRDGSPAHPLMLPYSCKPVRFGL